MSRDLDAVVDAIGRWEAQQLIDRDTAASLRLEADQHAKASTKRLGQYLLAVAGGAALLIAGGLFVDWAWPLMDRSARAGALGIAGVVVVLVGVRIEGSGRWLPASYLLQTSGLLLLLGSFAYTEDLWEDQSVGGIVTGLLALAVPVILAPRAMRRSAVMPAVHLAMGMAFLAIFLDRATGLSGETIIWCLDIVLAGSIFTLSRLLVADPSGERYPWVLNAFVTAMFGGFILVALTGVQVFSLGDDVIIALDLWLALVLGVTLWGIHAGPDTLDRGYLGQLLAWLAILWWPLAFFTALEWLDGPAELALILVGGSGVVGFVYGNRLAFQKLMVISMLVFISALWYWAVDRGGALGAVAALGATAGLLFWLSGKTGGREATEADPLAG